MSATSAKRTAGFTIVEVSVVILVAGLLTTIIFGGLFSYYSANIASLARTTQDTDTTVALRTIEKDLSNATTFTRTLPTNTAPYGSGSASNIIWHYRYTNSTMPHYRVLIASTYATTSTVPYVAFTNTGAGCSVETRAPMQNKVIYYVSKDPTASPSSTEYNLYRRTLVNYADPALLACPGSTPLQKHSCALNMSRTTHPVCAASDPLLLRNVKKFNVDYFASARDASAIDDQYGVNEELIESAQSVRVTVTVERPINGRPVESTSSVRISPAQDY